jgi:hypothetical protein
MKSSVFWDVMPCSQLKLNLVLEEHVACFFRAGFSLGIFFYHELAGDRDPQNIS